MKVLIDTNIILDVLCNREEFYGDSSRIFKLCEVKKITGVVSALSIPNIVYIMRKELDSDRIQEILNIISMIFTIVDLKSDDLMKATQMNFKDYEDAVQSACATRMKVDYIITRNIKDFVGSRVVAIKPSEFIERLLTEGIITP